MNFSVRLLHPSITASNVNFSFLHIDFSSFFALISANDNNQCHLLQIQSQRCQFGFDLRQKRDIFFLPDSFNIRLLLFPFFCLFHTAKQELWVEAKAIDMFELFCLVFVVILSKKLQHCTIIVMEFSWNPFDFSIFEMAFNLDGMFRLRLRVVSSNPCFELWLIKKTCGRCQLTQINHIKNE